MNQQRAPQATPVPVPASASYLPGVVVDNEALVPAAEVLVRPNLALEFLQQRLVGSLPFSVHRGTDVVQDAHDSRGILGNEPLSGHTVTAEASGFHGSRVDSPLWTR